MSLSGQWIGRYTGSNTGRLVIELDDVGDHYEGTAIVWDEVSDHFNALVRIVTPSKANIQRLDKLPVAIIDNIGNFVSGDVLKNLLETKNIVYPATVDVTLELKHKTLEVNWTSSTGGFGNASAAAPKTRDEQKSQLKARRLNTWDGFKRTVNKLEERRYIFRGQQSNQWRLRSSFYRSGRANMEKYLLNDISDLQRTFSGLSQHVFNLGDANHYAAFLSLAQHHGYPTPMLDWTWSPYVAAFFAFRGISKGSANQSRAKVRILKFDSRTWNSTFSRASKLFPIWPNVSVLDPLAFGNARAIPQQGIATVSNVDDMESHISELESQADKVYLEAIDLPASERNVVMRELALMGITAGSLFPGLDGACEALKERNF